MEIQRVFNTDGDAKLVHRYGDGFIVVNNETIETSAILTPNTVDTSWPPEHFDDIEGAHLEALLEIKPDLVLLGTGKSQQFPAPHLVAPLYKAHVGVEVMDTAAACRTFNILMNEGRKVVAGILMIH